MFSLCLTLCLSIACYMYLSLCLSIVCYMFKYIGFQLTFLCDISTCKLAQHYNKLFGLILSFILGPSLRLKYFLLKDILFIDI